MASNILPIFWNLASASKDTRLNSSAELISSLEGFQKTYAEARESKAESSEDEDEDDNDDDDDDDEDAESGVEVDGDDDMDGEGNEAARTEAKELDKRLDKDNAADVVYAVKRLIRGLGSSRDSSRLGFAVALTELLSRISSVSPAQAISLLLRSSQTSKNNKGQENRDLLFARLFGITAVVNSGSLFSQTATIEDFRVVTGELVNLGRRKGWLRESAWWTLITAIEGLLDSQVAWSSEAVDEVVDKLYGREGEGGWSSEKVALTLMLEQKRPDLEWKSLLAPTFKHTPLLASANLVTLAPILKGSDVEDDEEDSGIASTGSWKPQPHFVWDTVLERYFTPNATTSKQAPFQDFCRVVVDESLFANSSSSERKYWGFSIILTSLPKLPAELLPQIFTPNFMRSWINHLSSQDRYLHKAALQTAQALQETVKSNPKVGFTLLSQLVGKHGRPDFDKVTKTKLVETIMGNLSTEGVDEYVVYLQGIIMGSQQDKNGVDPKVTQDRRHWALDQLLALCRDGSVPKSDNWVSSILDFMLVHGFFNIRKTDKKSNIVALQSTPRPPLSEVTAAICRSRFFSCLLEITTATPSLSTSADASQSKRQQGCDSNGKLWLLRVLDTVTALEKDKKHVEPILDADDEIRQMRQSAIDTLNAISKLKKGDNALARGTEVLLAFLILQTYDESEDALDLLEETQVAARRMFALDPTSSTSSPTDAAPVDTMLDTLIALLDKGSSDLRNLANLVAGLISSAFTKSSIEHLNAQLESTVAESAEIVDEDDSDAAAHDDDDEDMGDEEEESEEDNSDSEEDEDDDDTAVVDPAFRARVAAALQVSGMNVDENGNNNDDDDDGSDESDDEVWDDEQMMKVDEQLAAVFREQRAGAGSTDKKAEKNLQTESIHFKARILDLYDVYAKKQPTNPLVLQLVVPLLSIIKNSGNAAAALSNKASSVIRSRFNKAKELPSLSTSSSSAEEGVEVLTKIHDLARKTFSAEFTNLCTICSLFVVRSIDSASTSAVKVYAKTVDEYMTHKQTLLHANFLTEFFKRHPQRAWPLHTALLPYLGGKGVVNIYRQNVAYELIALFAPQLPAIHKVHAQEVDSMIPQVIDAFYATLQAAAADEAWKADRLRDFLKPVLAFARATRSVGYAWDLERFDKVRESLKDGRLGKFGSVNSLLSQIRAVVGKDLANGSATDKKQGASKKRGANGNAKDGQESEPEQQDNASPVAPKKRKEVQDKTKPKKVKAKASKA